MKRKKEKKEKWKFGRIYSRVISVVTSSTASTTYTLLPFVSLGNQV